MTECEYCGTDPEEYHECDKCGDTFCYVHSAPAHHKCPELSEESTGEVTCNRCGSAIDDPEKCPDCGGIYCENHTGQITHNCPNYERPTTSSSAGSLAEIEVEESDGLLADGLLGGRVPVLVIAGLLVIGLGTGVLGPGIVGGVFGNSGGGNASAAAANGTTTPTVAENPPAFDEDTFRQEVLGWVNEQRSGEALSVNESRQAVAESVAEDMAEYGYPDNPTSEARQAWNVSRRLDEAGATCRANRTGSVATAALVRTSYNERLRTGDGEIEVYTTTEQLAEAVTENLGSLPNLGPVFDSDGVDTQALGVHKDGSSVYVVYIGC